MTNNEWGIVVPGAKVSLPIPAKKKALVPPKKALPSVKTKLKQN